MKARNNVHVFLKGEIFDLEQPRSPSLLRCGGRGGAIEAEAEAATTAGGSVVGSPLGGMQEEQLCVQNFFAVDLQKRVMELTNAILRQFVFRAYGHHKPDILMTFNRVFPREACALTSKSIVLALLNEMGFAFESVQQQEDERCSSGERFSQLGCASFTFRPRFFGSIADTSMSSIENGERAKNESVLEQIVRHALRQFHHRHPGRYCTHPTDSSPESSAHEAPRSSMGNIRVSRNRAQDKKNSFEDCPLGEDTASAMRSFFSQYPSEKGQIIVISDALLMQHVRYANTVPLSSSDVEIAGESCGALPKENSLTDEACTRSEDTGKLIDLLTVQKGVRVLNGVLFELFCIRDRRISFSSSTDSVSISRGSVDCGIDLPGEPWPKLLILPSLLSLYLQQQMSRHMPTPEAVLRRLACMDRDQLMCSKSLSMRDSLSTFVFSPGSQVPRTGACSASTDSMPMGAGDGIVSVGDIEKMPRIGRGSSGELFAVPRIDNGELVAVKRIYLTEHSQKQLEKELSVLKHCGGDIMAGSNEDAHAVVRCYDAFCDGGCAFIVMELMDSGSLIDAFSARSARAFTEEECCATAFQVLHGLRYLHDTIRQLHRDIKPHNILLNRATGSVKLADFGLSSSTLQSMGFHQCGSFVGTLAYMSPARVDADSVYGTESDFWSLGITLLQLALGRLPFDPSLFTIVSMAGQPPRLPVESDGKVGPFSSAFHEFIALLLPRQNRREHQRLRLTNFDLDIESSLKSPSNTYSNSNTTATKCPAAGESAITSKSVSLEKEPPVRKSYITWSSSIQSSNSIDMKVDADQNTLEAEQEKMITANTLLQHSWFKEMTWGKSVAILSSISLEPEPTTGTLKAQSAVS